MASKPLIIKCENSPVWSRSARGRPCNPRQEIESFRNHRQEYKTIYPPANVSQHMKLVVVGMGYVGTPVAALFADVPSFKVTGMQRRSARSAWKIDALN